MKASKGLSPTGWHWGVYSPKPLSQLSETEKERREGLDAALKRHGLLLGHSDDDWWPQWEYFSRHQDWDPLALPSFQLHQIPFHASLPAIVDWQGI